MDAAGGAKGQSGGKEEGWFIRLWVFEYQDCIFVVHRVNGALLVSSLEVNDGSSELPTFAQVFLVDSEVKALARREHEGGLVVLGQLRLLNGVVPAFDVGCNAVYSG